MEHIKLFEDFSDGNKELLNPNYTTKPGDIVICFGGEDGVYVRVDKESYLDTREFQESARNYYESQGFSPEIFREPGIEYIIQDMNNDFFPADADEILSCSAIYDASNPARTLQGSSSDDNLVGFNLPEPGRWFNVDVYSDIAGYDEIPYQ